MRAVVQRVRAAAVSAKGEVTGSIGPGVLLLLGVRAEDGEKEIT
ncbi:MAG: D-aminoacyl-tRNA deacylase, partial [Alkalispirochaetaceae bacterium]